MAAKIALIFFAAFVLFQLFSIQTDATIIRRDAPPREKDELEETINSFKKSVEEVIQKIQNTEWIRNMSKLTDEFGQNVRNQAGELIHKIKTNPDDKN